MTPAGQKTESAAADARALLSFALLIGVLGAGFALAMGHAELSPGFANILSPSLN
ncbi:hypothetical protein [Tabrizicola sp.]|jgi:hypothetical protein|uniref:hypothetical protein n=1 Tax=Tabrizicola sp. TaxID=2005166 RepID=UPI003D2A69FE